MQFNKAQYDATVKKIGDGTRKIQDRQSKLAPAASRAMNNWYLPQSVKEAIRWALDKLTAISNWVMKKTSEIMVGVGAPLAFFEVAWRWESVKGHASTVQGSINPAALGSSRWKGDAKDDYRNAITLQAPAAGRIKDISGSTAGALNTCAVAGIAFYVGVAIVVYQFYGTLGTALAAFITGALALPAALAAVGDAALTGGALWTLVTTLGICLASQAKDMISLRGDTMDNSAFPHGRWPKATA